MQSSIGDSHRQSQGVGKFRSRPKMLVPSSDSSSLRGRARERAGHLMFRPAPDLLENILSPEGSHVVSRHTTRCICCVWRTVICSYRVPPVGVDLSWRFGRSVKGPFAYPYDCQDPLKLPVPDQTQPRPPSNSSPSRASSSSQFSHLTSPPRLLLLPASAPC